MNKQVLKPSLLAFSLAFMSPFLLELLLGYTLIQIVWIIIPIAFHEVGHLVFGYLVSPLFRLVPQLYFLASPLHFLGGYLFNGIAGLFGLGFSLLLFKKLSEGKFTEKHRPIAFSFLIIAYLNIMMVPYTLTHLGLVVGPGADFTSASYLLGITLDELLVWMHAFNWLVLGLALLINAFFIFRKKP